MQTKRNATDIRNDIKTVITTAGQLQTRIHELSLECIEHAQEHGDVTLIDFLVKELPKGQRVEALKLWVETFTPIRWNGKDEVGMLKAEAKTFTPFAIEKAASEPYYKLTKETIPRELSLEALMNIVNGFTKRIDKAEQDGTVKDGENVDTLRAYASKLQAIATPTNVVSLDVNQSSETTEPVEETDVDTLTETTPAEQGAGVA